MTWTGSPRWRSSATGCVPLPRVFKTHSVCSPFTYPRPRVQLSPLPLPRVTLPTHHHLRTWMPLQLVTAGSNGPAGDTVRVWDLSHHLFHAGAAATEADAPGTTAAAAAVAACRPGAAALAAGHAEVEEEDMCAEEWHSGRWALEQTASAGNGQTIATLVSSGRNLIVGHCSDSAGASEITVWK